MVISVFALGLLMTAALYRPVLQGIFQVDSWLYEHWWARLLGGVLVVGYFEQWLVYLTVRYSVFEHPEFDERIDGVIYAIAAGLGMATVLNFFYVIDRGGVDLDIGSIRMVVNALAFASFAGLLGYFMGQARFESTPITYLPTGLTLAALLNGLFFFALEQTGNNGLSGHPWRDLIWAALLAVVTLLLLFWLMARANEETLRLAHSRVQLPATQPASESLPAPVKENGA
jgi:RsiW-degrading membrane proteinase PrsW (M82 family)